MLLRWVTQRAASGDVCWSERLHLPLRRVMQRAVSPIAARCVCGFTEREKSNRKRQRKVLKEIKGKKALKASITLEKKGINHPKQLP